MIICSQVFQNLNRHFTAHVNHFVPLHMVIYDFVTKTQVGWLKL